MHKLLNCILQMSIFKKPIEWKKPFKLSCHKLNTYYVIVVKIWKLPWIHVIVLFSTCTLDIWNLQLLGLAFILFHFFHFVWNWNCLECIQCYEISILRLLPYLVNALSTIHMRMACAVKWLWCNGCILVWASCDQS